jgi:hypothetical protein
MNRAQMAFLPQLAQGREAERRKGGGFGESQYNGVGDLRQIRRP